LRAKVSSFLNHESNIVASSSKYVNPTEDMVASGSLTSSFSYNLDNNSVVDGDLKNGISMTYSKDRPDPHTILGLIANTGPQPTVRIILNLQRCRPCLAPKVMETLRVIQHIKRRQSTSVQGLINKLTWYKNRALITRIAIYSGQTRFDLTFVTTSWHHQWDPTLGITIRRISAMANTTHIVTTVMKPVTNLRDTDATPRVNIQDFCEEYYNDILPIVIDKVRRDKRKKVHARLDFREGPGERRTREGSHHSSARTLSARLERLKVRDRLRYNDGHVFDRLGHRRQSTFDRLSETYSPSTTKSRPGRTSFRDRSRARSHPHRLDASIGDRPENKECFCGIRESGSDSESSSSSVSKSDSSDGRHRKSKSKRYKPTDEDDLTMPWMCEETYDKTGDAEDHVKKFQAAAQVERWATPTWCHMFNSTLIGAARVWFDELLLESIDSYKDLKAAFLAYFMQQKKYVKDPVKIHNIKKKDGETKTSWNELTKRLNEHVPKTMEEMMITTIAFIRGEAAAANKKKVTHHEEHRTNQSEKLQKKGKFQSPPPMVTPVEKRSSNKFCDFHNDKGYSTDECMQLQKQIEELARAGKLSPGIKEIQAVPSTAHGMLKFLADRGIVTIRSTILIPTECTTVITASEVPKEAGVCHKNFKVALHLNFPDQEVAIGGTFSAKGRTELCSLLKKTLIYNCMATVRHDRSTAISS
nr:hypothetical protein [Tanacetum cinerariifolium]